MLYCFTSEGIQTLFFIGREGVWKIWSEDETTVQEEEDKSIGRV